MRVSSSGLLVPENVLDATEEYLTPQQAAIDTAESKWFHDALKARDSRLSLIFVKPGSVVFPYSPMWYIVRRNDNAPQSFWAIHDGEYGYCRPTQRHLDAFFSTDAAARPDLRDQIVKQRHRELEAKEKARQEKHREFREKLTERLAHEFDASVPVTGKMKKAFKGVAGA